VKTILVPVDLSADATRVCKAARGFAKLVRARLVLMHVLPLQPILPADYYLLDADASAKSLLVGQKQAARRLRALARRCAGENLTVRAVQSTGEPAALILAQARECEADYIVIGSHGHNAAYDLLVVSVLQSVLRKARCPVLVIPLKRK
jgi:nucleotide-binding universal stress UspA family protein